MPYLQRQPFHLHRNAAAFFSSETVSHFPPYRLENHHCERLGSTEKRNPESQLFRRDMKIFLKEKRNKWKTEGKTNGTNKLGCPDNGKIAFPGRFISWRGYLNGRKRSLCHGSYILSELYGNSKKVIYRNRKYFQGPYELNEKIIKLFSIFTNFSVVFSFYCCNVISTESEDSALAVSEEEDFLQIKSS